jgi:O-antigen/teichoic acid export membrane protein
VLNVVFSVAAAAAPAAAGVLVASAGAGVAAAAVVAAAAGPLTALVLGADYGESAAVLRILALGLPLLFVDVLAVWLAYAAGKERGVVAVSGVALVANLALNAVLIPALDVRGAAIATVASEAVNLAGYAALFRARLVRDPRRLRLRAAAFASWALCCAAFLLALGVAR